MSHRYMLPPALLMDIDSTFSTVVDMGLGIFSTNRALHWLSPKIIFINLTPLIPLSFKGEGERVF